MISVIQRCSKAKVDIKNKTVGEIGHGMVVLLGIQKKVGDQVLLMLRHQKKGRLYMITFY